MSGWLPRRARQPRGVRTRAPRDPDRRPGPPSAWPTSDRIERAGGLGARGGRSSLGPTRDRCTPVEDGGPDGAVRGILGGGACLPASIASDRGMSMSSSLHAVWAVVGWPGWAVVGGPRGLRVGGGLECGWLHSDPGPDADRLRNWAGVGTVMAMTSSASTSASGLTPAATDPGGAYGGVSWFVSVVGSLTGRSLTVTMTAKKDRTGQEEPEARKLRRELFDDEMLDKLMAASDERAWRSPGKVASSRR